MLSDKDIASDALDMMKHSTAGTLKACLESSNPKLRQTLMQLVTEGEKSQFQMFELAAERQWYLPASQAGQEEIQRIKEFYATPTPV